MRADGEPDSLTRALAAIEPLPGAPRRRGLTLAAIEAAVARAAPDVPAGLERRELLAAVVRALVDAGRVELPRTPSSWEEGAPPLPRWVSRVDVARPDPARRKREFLWALELMWARRLPLTDAQFEALVAVQEWLASWLRDPELEAFAVEVLFHGRRAMQEQVGPRVLRELAAEV